MAIAFKGVRFSYVSSTGERILALDDMNMLLENGSISSIVGPSGCGKSTILSLIIGLLLPSSGTISICPPLESGCAIKFGISFQYPALLSWKTVWANVQLPILMHPECKVSENKVEEILELTGLSAFKNRYPHELSGGMQTRASLGRALILEPAYVLLDEPFGALDEKTTIDLMNLITSINRRLRITFVVVTHSVQQAIYFSDTVYTLSARPGRVLNKYAIDFSKPRSLAQPQLLALAEKIRADLGIKDGT